MSPALAGRFLTTEPPGKPWLEFFELVILLLYLRLLFFNSKLVINHLIHSFFFFFLALKSSVSIFLKSIFSMPVSKHVWPTDGVSLCSSTLAWKIPWMEEPGRLQSLGSLRVGHDWVGSLSLFTFTNWRRKWQPTPVFLPGESQGRRSLVGCCLWGHTELDTTEAT